MAACSTALSPLLVACLSSTSTIRQGRRISGQNACFAAQPPPPHTFFRGLSLSPCRRLQCGQRRRHSLMSHLCVPGQETVHSVAKAQSRGHPSHTQNCFACSTPSWVDQPRVAFRLIRLFLSSQSGCPAGSTSPPSFWQSFKAPCKNNSCNFGRGPLATERKRIGGEPSGGICKRNKQLAGRL